MVAGVARDRDLSFLLLHIGHQKRQLRCNRMAAMNPNANPPAREQFLLQLAPVIQQRSEHRSSSSRCSAKRFVRRVNWTVDDRQQLPQPQQQQGPRPALNHLYIRHGFRIRFSPGGNQGPISGVADMVGMRNGQPICVVEVKRYEQDNVHFAHGVTQAFVSAASLGQPWNSPSMRAITCDMRRWRFMTVNPNDYSLSKEERIPYNQASGVPSADHVQRMIRRLATFLAA